MQHTDFFARIRAIKTEEYKELQAAVELHGGIYEWDLRNPEHPVIAVNLNGIIPGLYHRLPAYGGKHDQTAGHHLFTGNDCITP